MTTADTFVRKSKYSFGVAILGLISGVLVYVLDKLGPCFCELVITTVGITLEGLRAAWLLSNVQVTVCARVWQNLDFLQILAKTWSFLWPLLNLVAG
jgi:hypothetical protein